MRDTHRTAILAQLDLLLQEELSGVVRYLHYSFMVFGPNRIPIGKWFRDQAQEGMAHAVLLGEKITALGGHPTVAVRAVPESHDHQVTAILQESLTFEREALADYVQLLHLCGDDIALEELARQQIRKETEHIEEVEKMLRGPGQVEAHAERRVSGRGAQA